jgi:hypothetical protein
MMVNGQSSSIPQMTNGHIGDPFHLRSGDAVRSLDGQASEKSGDVTCIVVDVDIGCQLAALACLLKPRT